MMPARRLSFSRWLSPVICATVPRRDGGILIDLTDQDLKEIGVSSSALPPGRNALHPYSAASRLFDTRNVVWIKVIDVLHAPRSDEGLDRASYDPLGLEVSGREVLEKGVGFD